MIFSYVEVTRLDDFLYYKELQIELGKIVGKNIFNLMDTGCSECTLTKSNIRKMLFDESWSCKTKHSTRKKSIKIKAHKTRFDNKNAFLLIFEDVTMQQEIDKMKASFVSMASHQLNTPLSTIRWYLELLSDKKTGKLNVKQKEYLKQIVDSNSRMISLVSDVLSVSHIESGEDIVSEKKPTDIVSIIKRL